MKILLKVGALALALLSCVPAIAQHATTSAAPGGYAPEQNIVTVPADGTAATITAGVTGVAVTFTASSSAGTLISGPAGATCTFSSGTTVCGPFSPRLGYPIRLVFKGGATFTGYVGTTTGTDCTTSNQLTAGGSPIGYSGSVDEFADVAATTGNIKYCVSTTVTSGTETGAVRQ